MPATPLTKCLYCGHKINRAEATIDNAPPPSKGDFTVCLYCDALMVFKADLTLRRPTKKETREAKVDADVASCLAFNREYRRLFPPSN